MFAYIKGVLTASLPGSIVLENGGIGYKIFIPVNAFHELPQMGDQIVFYTSFIVRELSHTLYGFLSPYERDFFEILMGVTGVGPKLALALIGHMPLVELQQAIANEDAAKLCHVPGIGKKGAERLIIELRDKLAASSCSTKHVLHEAQDPKTRIINDAMSALISLGYNQNTAQKAIKRSLEHFLEMPELPNLISAALKHV